MIWYFMRGCEFRWTCGASNGDLANVKIVLPNTKTAPTTKKIKMPPPIQSKIFKIMDTALIDLLALNYIPPYATRNAVQDLSSNLAVFTISILGSNRVR